MAKDEPAEEAETTTEDTRPRPPQLWRDLEAIDANARKHGHSLAEILVKAARDAFGIDVRPAPEGADEDED